VAVSVITNTPTAVGADHPDPGCNDR
jgi:hypothetical protein